MELLDENFGISFFMQYFGGRVLDKISFSKDEPQSKRQRLTIFYLKTLEQLCENNGWEFDEESVSALLNKQAALDKIIDEKRDMEQLLCSLLGQDYEELYNKDIVVQWEECIAQCLCMQEFEDIFKYFFQQKIQELENGQQKIIDKLEQIQIKDEIIRKESMDRERQVSLQEALEDMDAGDYEKAIAKFKQINYWTEDSHIKFSCQFYIGFCYAKQNIPDRLKKALSWFQKAERCCDYETDDAVLLLRNIALTYLYIGESEDRLSNYEMSNSYFRKIITILKKEDSLDYYDAIIHIARNYLDICDDVPSDKTLLYLEAAELLMCSLFDEDCELNAELFAILVHNMARVYYHKAEKVDSKYIKTAQQLYEYVLTTDYAKQNTAFLAMTNENAGMAYQYDLENRLENAKIAIGFYETAAALYQSEDVLRDEYRISNAKLNIAAACKMVYAFTGEEKYFKKSITNLREVTSKGVYTHRNTLFFRTYLMQLDLYTRVPALHLGLACSVMSIVMQMILKRQEKNILSR